MANYTYTLTTKDETLYVKEILQRRLSFSSRLRRKLKVAGGIEINGEPVWLNARGKAGDVLTVSFPEEESCFEPQDLGVRAVYEDEDLLIADKPAGMVVHPTRNFQDGTLANALAWHIRQSGQAWKIRFVNRLDMNTSGLVIVAKNAHAQDFLSHEMERGAVRKIYLALAHGIVGEPGIYGTVDAPIDKDPDHVARRHVTPDGYPSVTHYRVLRTFEAREGAPDGFSLLALRLETGRTHQIRVHMTHIGHPLVGDDLYDPVCGYGETPWMPRQALHAARLEFTHPVSGETIAAESPLPADILAVTGPVDGDYKDI